MKLVNTAPPYDEIVLPPGLIWTDELTWTPVTSTYSYSLDGSLFVEQSRKLSGRPITLESQEDMGWVTRETVLALQSIAATIGSTMMLHLEKPPDTRVFRVAMMTEGSPISSLPIKRIPQFDPKDWFSLTLRLIEVPV